MNKTEIDKLTKGGLTFFNNPRHQGLPGCAAQVRLLPGHEKADGRHCLGIARKVFRASGMSTEAQGLTSAVHGAAAAGPTARGRGGLRRAALTLDRWIGMFVEFDGALLVWVETCILFAGVVSRYVFNCPILWTLTSWRPSPFPVVGDVRRGRRAPARRAHAASSTFAELGRAGRPGAPGWRRWRQLVVIVFSPRLKILLLAQQYLQLQMSTELITLHISDGYRVGVALLKSAPG